MTAHEKLVNIWSRLEFGVKSRVHNEYAQQKVKYILDHPKYQNEDLINEILDRIEFHSREVLDEITEMYNQVTS